jgi:KipI family sensor histidine kinase inhibitor
LFNNLWWTTEKVGSGGTMGERVSRPAVVRRVGRDALLIEVDGDAVPAWYAELCRRREAGELTATEIVPAARTVLLDGVPDTDRLATAIPGWSPPPVDAAPPAPPLCVPTVYDGPDLADVADRWGMSPEAAVKTHTSIEFRVAFCGFAPGFAYLTGLPPELHVPRHDDPRPRVPAGSVALAGEYAAVYPAASPGGWRLIGRTDLVLFDLAADPPARLAPGTRVRFTVAMSAAEGAVRAGWRSAATEEARTPGARSEANQETP